MFSYIFYRTYCAYQKHHESSPQIQSIGVISCMQGFNALTILKLMRIQLDINKLWGGVALIILFIINYNIYNRRIQNYKDRWKDESLITRRLKGWLIIVYIILSISLFMVVITLYN